MQANLINGWREVLARVFEGFEIEYGLSPDWLVNPGTNRRLKLDYYLPEITVAVRFVDLEGPGRQRRKSDEERENEAERERARASVCREHGVVLLSIDPTAEPRTVIRGLEAALARASAQLAQSPVPQERKQALMPKLSLARQRAGDFTVKLTNIQKMNLYAEMWWDRQAALSASVPAKPRSSAPQPIYTPGMEVEHERFGRGVVMAVEPEEGDLKVTVDFPESGVRSFYASLVGDRKLQVIEAR